MTEKKLILFDGVCLLCNGAIQFVLKRDRKGIFQFAPLQSDAAKMLLEEHRIIGPKLSTIVLIDHGQAYTESTAALRIVKNLPGIWALLYALIIVPPFIRNGIYRWVAKHRYRWFGRTDSCMVPTPEIRERFVA